MLDLAASAGVSVWDVLSLLDGVDVSEVRDGLAVLKGLGVDVDDTLGVPEGVEV